MEAVMQAAMVELDLLEADILRKIVQLKTLGDLLKERATIVLAALSNTYRMFGYGVF